MTAHAILWEAGRLGWCLAAALDAEGRPAIAVDRLAGDPWPLPHTAVIAAHLDELHALLTERPELGECWYHRERRQAQAQAPQPISNSSASRPTRATPQHHAPTVATAPLPMLLPLEGGRPPDARTCADCGGSGTFGNGVMHVGGRGGRRAVPITWPCDRCKGLGWLPANAPAPSRRGG